MPLPAGSILDSVAHALQLSLGVVFLFAALSKLGEPNAFVRTVADYRLVPGTAARVLAPALIAVECFLGVALLTGLAVGIALPLTIVTLLAFSAAVAVNLRRGRRVPCGCFGHASERVSTRTLVRLLLLLLASLALLLRLLAGGSRIVVVELLAAGPPGLGRVLGTGGLAAFLILMTMWLMTLPELVSMLRKPDQPASHAGHGEDMEAI